MKQDQEYPYEKNKIYEILIRHFLLCLDITIAILFEVFLYLDLGIKSCIKGNFINYRIESFWVVNINLRHNIYYVVD